MWRYGRRRLPLYALVAFSPWIVLGIVATIPRQQGPTAQIGGATSSRDQQSTQSSQPEEPTWQQKIAADAQRYAWLHSRPDRDLVDAKCKDRCLRVPLDDCRAVYDRAFYDSLPQRWRDFWAFTGPAGLILFTLGWIFKDKLRHLATSGTVSLLAYARRHFKSSRLLRHFTLRRYRERLREDFGLLRMPFWPNRSLSLDTLYVSLKLTKGVHGGSPNTVDGESAVRTFKHVVVVGPPGAGKTVLLKHLALTYGHASAANGKDLVPIFFPLSRCNENRERIANQLLEILRETGVHDPAAFLADALHRGDLLLLFDGLDEVIESRRNEVVADLCSCLREFRRCAWILTCRDAVYRHDLLDLCEAELAVQEFSDFQMRDFLSYFSSLMPQGKSVDQLMGTLHDRPRLMALARNPLMLTIVARLYVETNHVLPHSRAEFFRHAIGQLLDEWHGQTNTFPAATKLQILLDVALTIQDLASSGGQDVRTIEASSVYDIAHRVLPEYGLPASQGADCVDEIVRRSGLLLSVDAGARFQFAHLSLQEYLVAKKLASRPQQLLARYAVTPDRWKEPIRLWCGLDVDSSELLLELAGASVLFAVECLADASRVKEEIATALVQNCLAGFRLEANREPLMDAIAALAASGHARGREVFAFLERELTAGEDSAAREAAAAALGRTNLPQAAELLARQFERFNYVRDALIRMGDVAVPPLEAIAQRGILPAVAAMREIRTPTAVQALARLMEVDVEVVERCAAWALSSLLVEPGALGALEKLKPYAGPEEWQWVWQPFDQRNGTALASKIGRVARVLSRPQGPPVELGTITPDVRLILPLAIARFERQFADRSAARWDKEESTLGVQVGPQVETRGGIDTQAPESLLRDTNLQRLLCLLPAAVRELLVEAFASRKKPTRQHWINLHGESTYEYSFADSWQQRVAAALVASGCFVAVSSWVIGFGVWFAQSTQHKALVELLLVAGTALNAWAGALMERSGHTIRAWLTCFVAGPLQSLAVLLGFVNLTSRRGDDALSSSLLLHGGSAYLLIPLWLSRTTPSWAFGLTLAPLLAAAFVFLGCEKEKKSRNPLSGVREWLEATLTTRDAGADVPPVA